jgi:1-phosphatidylinositol phosphodiesterase
MAFYGWPIAQCQSLSTPLFAQLRAGIRVVDIRLSLIKGKLIAYHSVYPQRESFQSILATFHTVLSDPSPGARETIVVSIKQENFQDVDSHTFSGAVRAEIEQSVGGLNLWFFENRIPTLGEVRGKCILFSRFGANGAEWPHGLAGLGIHPTSWPDSAREVWEWTCANTRVRTHDWYKVPTFLSIPEKVQRATAVLLPPAEALPAPTLNISFLSASSFPLAAPPTIAKGFGWPSAGFGVEGVNARVTRWILGMLSGGADGQRVARERPGRSSRPTDIASAMEKAEAATVRTEGDGASDEAWEKSGAARRRSAEVEVEEPRVRGWTFMDFYTQPEDSLVPLLIELNFRGRRSGEEGWP